MSNEIKQYLFGPKNEKDLKNQYPELGREPEFSNLTVGELLFVWWYSNATSPLCRNDNMSDKERIMAAYKEAFARAKVDEDRFRKYCSGDFPDRVKMAVDRMRKYNPSVRMRAQAMIEKILDKYEELIDVDLDQFEEVDENGDKKTNWSGRNSYVTSAKNIAELLPSLIKQVEEGFGVVETKDGEGGMKAIQRYHKTNPD